MKRESETRIITVELGTEPKMMYIVTVTEGRKSRVVGFADDHKAKACELEEISAGRHEGFTLMPA